MEKAKELKATITLLVGVLTGLWGWIGWCVLIFLISMLLDYLTGSWAAMARGEWSSAAAREGQRHKLGEIVALLVAALCDIAVRIVLQSAAAPILGGLGWKNYVSMLVCIWYVFTELGSIIENAGKLGAPLPKWLVKSIAALRGRIDKAAPGTGDEKQEEQEDK